MTRIYRFDDFEVNAASREVRYQGELVDTQRKVFDFLLYLIEHRERAVDKEELQTAVWPGQFITEAAMSRCVMKARKALGDDADRQAFIKTVHGHGFRFAAYVTVVSDAQSESPRQETSSPIFKTLPWLGGALFVAIIGLYFTFTNSASLLIEGKTARIAILPIANKTDDPELDWIRLGLMNLLENLIRNNNVINIIESKDVLKTVNRVAASESTEDGTSAKELQRIYSTTHVVEGDLEQVGDLYRLNFTITDENGKSITKQTIGKEVFGLVNEVSREILVSVIGETRSGDFRIVSNDAFVNEAYSRGLSLSLRGNAPEAINLFKVAIDQEPTAFWPRYQYALANTMIGNQEIAKTAFDKLRQEGQQASDIEKATVLYGLGILNWSQSQLTEAEALMNEALVTAEDLQDKIFAARLLGNLGVFANVRGDYKLARSRYERSLSLFEEGGYKFVPGALINSLGNLEYNYHNLEKADEYFTRALESNHLDGNRRLEAMIYGNLGLVRHRQGRYEDAVSLHKSALELSQELELKSNVGHISHSLSSVYLDSGLISEAEKAAQNALKIGEELSEARVVGDALTQIGEVMLAKRDFSQATKYFQQAKQVYEEIDIFVMVLMSDLYLMTVETERGNLQVARETTMSLLDKGIANEDHELVVHSLTLLGRIANMNGDTVRAIELLERGLVRARETGDIYLQTEPAIQLANIYMADNKIDETDSLVALVSDLQPSSYEVFKLRARLAHSRNQTSEATQLMAQARDAANERWTKEDEDLLTAYDLTHPP